MWLRLRPIVEAVHAAHDVAEFLRNLNWPAAPAVGTASMLILMQRHLEGLGECRRGTAESHRPRRQINPRHRQTEAAGEVLHQAYIGRISPVTGFVLISRNALPTRNELFQRFGLSTGARAQHHRRLHDLMWINHSGLRRAW